MTGNRGIGIFRVPPESKDRDASRKAIRNLAKLSTSEFDEVLIFDDLELSLKEVTAVPVRKPSSRSIGGGIVGLVRFQIRLSIALFAHRDRLDVTFWHSGNWLLLLPMLVAKLLRMKVVIAVLGKVRRGFSDREYWGLWSLVLPRLASVMQHTTYLLSDRIVVFSPSMLEYPPLQSFEEKIYQLKFNFESVPDNLDPVTKRDEIVVYLGRIARLKGADSVAAAVEQLSEGGQPPFDEVLFIGDGHLDEQLERRLNGNSATSDLVTFTGWLDREEAMESLEQATVYVLPSESEGLPKALQEAMARGVIPVVSPVGDIPNVVSDGHNGIVLDDTDPATVADGIEAAIDGDQLALSEQARRTIEEQFGFNTVREQFAAVMNFTESGEEIGSDGDY